ncbi:MAG TPA: hypothetical protein VHE35_07945 [Kofleriaceae bacterium]|nr:hypothetical protein [Kofleriaceae bacterium]
MTTRAPGTLFAIGLVTACTSGGSAGDDAARPPDGSTRLDAPGDVDAAGSDLDAPVKTDAGPSELDVYQSGARLKMRVGTTPDGAKTFLGWRDTMRDEDCAFAIAADGAQRCLPGAAATYTTDLFWGDAACTTVHLATTAAGCPVVSGYARGVTTCAPFRFTVYSLGAHYTGSVYVKSGAVCTLYTGQAEYYLLGAEVPADSFVEATESLE